MAELFEGPQQTGSAADAPEGGPRPEPAPDPLLRWSLALVARSEPKVKDWRRKVAIPAYRFLAGKQLTEEDEAILVSEGRPTTAFNTAQKYIRYISGVERDSPASLIVNAINFDAAQAQMAGDYLTKYYQWCINGTRGNLERSSTFESFLVSGLGCSEHFIDRYQDARGLHRIRRFSELELIWPDTDAINLSDARWLARESWVDTEEAKGYFTDSRSQFLLEMCSKLKDEGGSNTFAGPSSPNLLGMWPEPPRVPYKIPYVQSYPLSTLQPDRPTAGQVKLMCFQWWENAKGYIFLDPLSQQETWKASTDFTTYERRLGLAGIKIADKEPETSRLYKKMFILDRRFVLGDGPVQLPGNRFSINTLCCHFDYHNRWWYGFMSLIMDPQRYANKAFNQMLEALAVSTKGGYIAEIDAIGDPADVKKFQDDAAKPGSTLFVAPNALAEKRVQPKGNEAIPDAALAIINFCNSSMDVVTGISAESLGLGAGTAAGVTLRRRQRAGIVLLASEFDALSEYRKNEARIIFDHAEYISDDRLVLVGEDPYDQQILKLVREPLTYEYLVMLDEAEVNPDLKQQLLDVLSGPLGQTLINRGLFVPEMLNVLPFPRKWIESIKQQLEQKEQRDMQMRMQGIPVPGQRGQQKTPQERQADITLKKAGAFQKIADAQTKMAGMKRDNLQMIFDMIQGPQGASTPPVPPLSGNGGPPQAGGQPNA